MSPELERKLREIENESNLDLEAEFPEEDFDEETLELLKRFSQVSRFSLCPAILRMRGTGFAYKMKPCKQKNKWT